MVKKKKLPQEGDLVYVDTIPSLEKALDVLKRHTVIGVDLEADSMFHFREKVCLIQIATPHCIFIVDPLAVNDLTLLGSVFKNKRIQKIFHGADYDIRSLYRDFHIGIHRLFDTELSCRFLGMSQTSLEKMVFQYFNETLDKKYQKKDWSQRPLPEKMIAYAATDVRYLIPLAAILENELRGKKRMAWVIEECQLLSQVRPQKERSLPLYMSVKGAGKLKPQSLAVLENLLALRKHLAEQRDRPLFKIIGNQSLLTLAVKKPTTKKELEESRSLSRLQMERYGEVILAAVQHALRLPDNELPKFPRGETKRYRASVAKRINALKSWKEQKAVELQIDPSLILNKSQVTAIASKNPSHIKGLKTIDPIRKWQLKEFGREIIDVLRHV